MPHRISFDGYGCREIGEQSISLDEESSTMFKKLFKKNIPDQKRLLVIVIHAIRLNKEFIWQEAIEEYNLL